MDKQLIIDAMTKAVASIQDKAPKGIPWAVLETVIIDLTDCGKKDFADAILEALDNGVLEEREPGWVRIPKEIDEDEQREEKDRRDEDIERSHDAAREWSATQ